ncbi:hypothetical protein NPIL_366411 [Nephila pilipes]|uniref:Uncharacterized protein n=1 Tax=Nephila pilipes TaxID=299642 RepID=A0A8X6U927_NEPPI|nr:hypothetical protein NPIL_366411 [Nephila pilipes]
MVIARLGDSLVFLSGNSLKAVVPKGGLTLDNNGAKPFCGLFKHEGSLKTVNINVVLRSVACIVGIKRAARYLRAQLLIVSAGKMFSRWSTSHVSPGAFTSPFGPAVH